MSTLAAAGTPKRFDSDHAGTTTRPRGCRSSEGEPMRLPRARGPLSSCLLTVLAGPVRRGCGLEEAATAAVETAASVLSDEDAQLLLLQELSSDGLDGVDDQWERSPDVVSARAVLEDAVEAELRAAVALSVRR